MLGCWLISMTNPDPPPDVDLRALDLFERLIAYPGNTRFRGRLLKAETPQVIAKLAQIEAGHVARAAMPTELPDWVIQPSIAPPDRIGPFCLAERIGRGGMADVWRGERDDGLFEQSVAIKLIHAHLDSRAQAAFDAERRILARLDHPDIVRLIDGGVTENGLPYLVMDHVEGVPFDEAVASLPFGERISRFIQAANVVQFAHSRLVAHADLKPSNIMVDVEGRVRLLDFGIAGLLAGEDDILVPTGAMTREFASPQRIAGESPSIADDVFALGRILALIAGDPAEADLAAIAAKATAYDTVARYETVAAMIADLARWKGGRPVSARKGGFAYHARKFIARHRFGVSTSILAVLALLAATAYATLSSVRAERARAEASARFDDARGTARYLLFTLMDRLEAKPNSLALRGEVANVAQHYLDRPSQADNAAPEVRIEAARGLIRLAEAQGVPGMQNLAQPARAKRSLDRALGLLGAKPTGEEAALAITALIYQARLSSLVDHKADQALDILKRADQLIAANPATPAILNARARNERAVAIGWKNEYAAVARMAEETLEILPEAANAETLMERAKASDLLAEATYYSHSPQASVQPYKIALARHEEAHKLYPNSRIIMERMERARWGLASTLLSMNRNAEALRLFDAGLTALEKMVAFDPDDDEAVRLLQIVGLDRAQATADLGRFDEAIIQYRANIAGRRAWLARRADEVRRLRDLAVAVKSLGDVQARGGHTAEACQTYAEFRALVAQMAKKGDLAEMDMDYTLAHLVQDERKYCPNTARRKIP